MLYHSMIQLFVTIAQHFQFFRIIRNVSQKRTTRFCQNIISSSMRKLNIAQYRGLDNEIEFNCMDNVIPGNRISRNRVVDVDSI